MKILLGEHSSIKKSPSSTSSNSSVSNGNRFPSLRSPVSVSAASDISATDESEVATTPNRATTPSRGSGTGNLLGGTGNLLSVHSPNASPVIDPTKRSPRGLRLEIETNDEPISLGPSSRGGTSALHGSGSDIEITDSGHLRADGFEIHYSGVVRTPEKIDEEKGDNSDMSLMGRNRRRRDTMGNSLKAEDVVVFGALGTGQNGTVEKAVYTTKLDVIALKTVNIHDTGRRHQLFKELSTFAKARHHNHILKPYGAYLDQENIVLGLEYMNRGSLMKLVQRKGPLSEDVLQLVTKQILMGLQHLHSHHQVHRDIKPENILVDHRGVAKISDFGLVKQLDSTIDVCSSFVGTMSYLSPQRLRGTKFSYAADTWSLGITLIYCATGRIPLPTEYWALIKHVTDEPSPSLDRSAFSEQLCDFIDKCLLKDEMKRCNVMQLLEHPWIKALDESKVKWPYSEPEEDDWADLDMVNRTIVDRCYSDGKFKNSMFDKVRFKKIANQLGFSTDAVLKNFREHLSRKYNMDHPSSPVSPNKLQTPRSHISP